jgi:NADH:ubiquinone oxidoreductase subunit 4 (subunit M)
MMYLLALLIPPLAILLSFGDKISSKSLFYLLLSTVFFILSIVFIWTILFSFIFWIISAVPAFSLVSDYKRKKSEQRIIKNINKNINEIK